MPHTCAGDWKWRVGGTLLDKTLTAIGAVTRRRLRRDLNLLKRKLLNQSGLKGSHAMLKSWVNIDTAAELIDVHPDLLVQWLNEGSDEAPISYQRLGKTMFHLDDLKKWRDQNS